jgi:hypothetical protein
VVDLNTPLSQELFDVGYDNAKRRYQRTASTITSGEQQKLAKADRTAEAGRGGGGFSCQQCRCFDAVAGDATVPVPARPVLAAHVSGVVR